MLRKILLATLIAGLLDIMSAFYFAGEAGRSATSVLHFVASGPFGDRALHGTNWAVAGLAVHFAIMAAMAGAYMLFAPGSPAIYNRPWLAGILYGLLLWGIMYWIVRPLRWPGLPLPTSAGLVGVAKQLFSHCVLVGLPIALIARMGGSGGGRARRR